MSKYPNRGGDCEYTEDCMWGVDGWCYRPHGWKCVIEEWEVDHEQDEKRRTLTPDDIHKIYNKFAEMTVEELIIGATTEDEDFTAQDVMKALNRVRLPSDWVVPLTQEELLEMMKTPFKG